MAIEIITFNKGIYSMKAVNVAVDAFKDLANIKVTEQDNDIAVEIDNIDSDVADTFTDEFSNYVLGAMS